MARFFFRIILVVLPFLVVIGLFRVVVNGYESTTFLPTYPELVEIFSTFPDFGADIKKVFGEVQDAIADMQDAFDASFNYDVHDVGSFFQSIGQFFIGVGQFFSVIGQVVKLLFVVISIPVQVIVWFFGNIIYVQDNAPVAI